MTVRTAVLARAKTTASGITVIGTVPAGHIWIVKEVLTFNGGTVASVFQTYWSDPTGLITGTLATPQLNPGSLDRVELWSVGDAGSTLTFFSQSSFGQVWVSGSNLVL